jgi:hypothetical protein
LFFLGAIAVLFVFILSTEVLDRWSQTVRRYKEVRDRENASVAPESLASHRRFLKARALSLHTELDKTSDTYSRTLAGFLSLVSASARMHNVKLMNVAPVRNEESANDGEVHFKVECQGEFHNIALLVNSLENSPLDIHITKIDIAADESKTKGLESSVEGRFKTGDAEGRNMGKQVL